jgi:hypothetical protein
MTFKENLANYVLGRISTQHLIDVATDALAEGLDSTSLRMLAAENEIDYNPQRIISLLNDSLKELKIILPSIDDATWTMLCRYIKNIADGSVPAREGMSVIINNVDLNSGTKEYFGDSHDMHELIGMYYGHDDIDERPNEVSVNGKYGNDAHVELNNLIVEAARNWSKKHCNIDIDE